MRLARCPVDQLELQNRPTVYAQMADSRPGLARRVRGPQLSRNFRTPRNDKQMSCNVKETWPNQTQWHAILKPTCILYCSEPSEERKESAEPSKHQVTEAAIQHATRLACAPANLDRGRNHIQNHKCRVLYLMGPSTRLQLCPHSCEPFSRETYTVQGRCVCIYSYRSWSSTKTFVMRTNALGQRPPPLDAMIPALSKSRLVRAPSDCKGFQTNRRYEHCPSEAQPVPNRQMSDTQLLDGPIRDKGGLIREMPQPPGVKG